MSENDASMDAYRTVLKDLKRRKKVIEAAIAGVTALLGESETTLQACLPVSLPKTQESGNATSGAFADLSLPEAAQIYLSTVKDPQSTADIAEALKRGGYPTKSRNFSNTVRSVLDRHAKTVGTIVKINKNWGLAEWTRDGGEW
ncbi:MAG: hypothetical protein OXF47_08620 [Nitrospira sp.]|nr:hypothetical protein [Nitrospira sp.]